MTAVVVDTSGDMITWGDATSEWRKEMLAAEISTGTIKLRTYWLNRFADTTRSGPANVDRRDLINWLASMKVAANTRRSARQAIVTFYTWAEEVGIVARSPAARLPPVRAPRGEPHPAAEDDVAEALDAASDRVRLMILLGAVSGLRRGEIALIHRDDLDGQDLYVHGKGRRERRVEIPRFMAAQIRLACRHNGWAFPGRMNGHLSAGRVGELVSETLPKGVSAHDLRHACADYLYNVEEWDILQIRDHLGHADISTTQIYTPNRRGGTGEAMERSAARFERGAA